MSDLPQIPEFWKRLKMIIYYSTFKTFLALPCELHLSMIACVRSVNSTMSKTSTFLHIFRKTNCLSNVGLNQLRLSINYRGSLKTNVPPHENKKFAAKLNYAQQ